MLAEVQECFINIAREIAKRELLLIVTPEPEEVKKQIAATVNMNNVRFLECATNDTWARDHGAITMIDTDTPSLLDFTFNGWGLKFASELDNLITGQAVKAGDVLVVLEAMKMENEIVAPQDGTVASVNVSKGDSVEAGQVIITLN